MCCHSRRARAPQSSAADLERRCLLKVRQKPPDACLDAPVPGGEKIHFMFWTAVCPKHTAVQQISLGPCVHPPNTRIVTPPRPIHHCYACSSRLVGGGGVFVFGYRALSPHPGQSIVCPLSVLSTIFMFTLDAFRDLLSISVFCPLVYTHAPSTRPAGRPKSWTIDDWHFGWLAVVSRRLLRCGSLGAWCVGVLKFNFYM